MCVCVFVHGLVFLINFISRSKSSGIRSNSNSISISISSTMSDEEDYEYEYDEDDDGDANMEHDSSNSNNPGFEYTDDEDDADDSAVALENAYYNAKGLRESSLEEAMLAFEQVIRKEREQNNTHYGPWSFKSMKQLVKLHVRTAVDTTGSNNTAAAAATSTNTTIAEHTRRHYARLLECIVTGTNISPNAVEKGISGMLERVASSLDQSLAVAVYEETLQVFHPHTGPFKNERLWFKANIKYGQLLYEMNETAKLQKVLKDLATMQQPVSVNDDASGDRHDHGGSSSSASSTQTMEIYSLQIQLYSRLKDHKRLRETFQKAANVRGGIPHPRTLALMQELGGKMHMSAREYEAAGKTFFQAFKSYDEAGDPSRLRCLKYLVLASMLHASKINPFDSQEARPYRDDPEIVAMTNLVQAFQNNEIKAFEMILKKNQGRTFMKDEFVREHIEDLLRTVRRQVLRRVIRPYTRVSLAALAHELNDVPVDSVESLLVGLILDGSLQGGTIDRVAGVLIKPAERGPGDTRDGPLAAAAAASSTSGGGASSTARSAAAMGAATMKPKSQTEERCRAMEEVISRLEELSTQVTRVRFKEGSSGIRSMV
jgi:COP9 signalosome complex subunit 2